MDLDRQIEPELNSPLRRALRIGGVLMLVYVAVTVAADWHFLLETRRYFASSQEALAMLGRAYETGVFETAYLRYYALVAFAFCGVFVAVALLLPSLLPRWREWRSGGQRRAIASVVLLVVLATLTLPVHLPYLLQALSMIDADLTLESRAELVRAVRDAMTRLWCPLLLIVIPIVGSAKVDRQVKAAITYVALGVVASTLLVHFGEAGGRTFSELVFFTAAMFALLSRGTRMSEMFRNEIRWRREAEVALARVETERGRVSELARNEKSLREQVEAALERVDAERVRYQEQSQAALRELSALEQQIQALKEEHRITLAQASHDLAHPLFAINTYSTLAAEDLASPLDPSRLVAARRHIDVVRAEARDLPNALKAVLGVRSEARLDAYRLSEIFATLERRFAPKAQQAGVHIRFVKPPDEVLIRTNQEYLILALSNLISNALKYGPLGVGGMRNRGAHVMVRVRVRVFLATIYVIDCGPGIPDEDIERIFDLGVRLRAGSGLGPDGHGFGLTIVRNIMRDALVRHYVRVRSRVGHGSHFMVDVPLEFNQVVPAVVDAGGSGDTGKPALRVLEGAMVAVIEDNDVERQGLVELLRLAGAFVMAASSPARIAALVADGDRYPDLILSDFHLGDNATGCDAIAAVRSCCRRDDVPAVILTADPRAAERATEALGAVEILSKPPDHDTLLRALARCYLPQPSPFDALR